MQHLTSPQPALAEHGSIDMLTPTESCVQLQLDHQALLALVNQGELAAYNLSGFIRFKVIDIAALAEQLVAA